MDRRSFLGGLLAGLSAPWLARSAAAQEGAQEGAGSAGEERPIGNHDGPVAIASANGYFAVQRAYAMMNGGVAPVDAAVGGVGLVEIDPDDLTVGYGGLPNFDGEVELDAAVMDGPSGRGGAVAALKGVKTPSQVALTVMRRSDHVLLVGEGARRFATMHGFPDEELLTEKTRKIWLHWRENLSDADDWVEPPVELMDPDVQRFVESHGSMFRPQGTIHLSAKDADGNLGCCTTTSGLFFKVPGRVGDSPLIGAGLYCDNDVGSAGGTGRGESAILACASHTAVEQMRLGKSPEQALMATLERAVDLNRDPRLRRQDGRPNFNLRLYAVDKAGAYASAAIWSGGKFAVADAAGSRIEEQSYLFKSES